MKTNKQLFTVYTMSLVALTAAQLSAASTRPSSAATEAYAAKVREAGRAGQAKSRDTQKRREALAATQPTNQPAVETPKPYTAPPAAVNWQTSPIYVSPSAHTTPPAEVNWQPAGEYTTPSAHTTPPAIVSEQPAPVAPPAPVMPPAPVVEEPKPSHIPPPPPLPPVKRDQAPIKKDQDQRPQAPMPATPEPTLLEQIRAGKKLRSVDEQPRSNLVSEPAAAPISMAEALRNAMEARRQRMGEESADTNDAEWAD